MGADLFIEEIHTPVWNHYFPLFLAAVRKRAQSPLGSRAAKAAQIEALKYSELLFSAGYFRDSYSDTSILECLGLSWRKHIIPLCNAERRLTGKKIKRFRNMVGSAKLKLPTRAELKSCGLTVKETGNYSLAGWHKYFRDQHARLLAFLDAAIACQGSIFCSL